MTSPNKAREGVSRATTNNVAAQGYSSLPPTNGTVAGPTPELERVARAIAENMIGVEPEDCYYAAYAALQVLLPVSDETVEAMGRAWVNNDPFVVPQPSHVLGLKNALTAAINHITGEGQ